MQFWFHLLNLAWSASFTAMGTTPLGLIVTVGCAIVPAFTSWRKHGWSHAVSLWGENIRDGLIVVAIVWFLVLAYQFCISVPNNIRDQFARIQKPPTPFAPIAVNPPMVDEIPKPTSPLPLAEPDGILTLIASIIHPGSPSIVVENASSKVAQGVIWELILWRESDSSYFSLPTQNIGFVKPHSKSAPYEMFAPGFAKLSDSNGRLIDGDSLTGTLSVDCPDCKGNTYIVHIVWGHGGWFHMIKGMNGKLAVPKEMTKEGINQYIKGLNLLIAAKDKIPIV